MPAKGRLLILHEPAGLGYFSDTLAGNVADCARSMGMSAELCQVPFSPTPAQPDQRILRLIQEADCTLFLARMGDQIRFGPVIGNRPVMVCYALDEAAMASRFGTAPNRGFLALKKAIDLAMQRAGSITVTCPLGTSFSGSISSTAPPDDVSVLRFPMSVFAPNSAAGFSGRIAQSGFLVGTGSTYYEPYACPLDGILFVEFEGERMTRFTGSGADVKRAEDHYARVADELGTDASFIHSWHAGIHPGCAQTAPASACFERWSGSAFGNPRLLHFHTCATYAPGEISLNVLDPTIRLDGIAVWEAGRLFPERIEGGREILVEFPDIRACFDNPEQDCGQGSGGQLSFG